MEFDFEPKVEEFKIGETKVIFKEPTEQQLPTREVPRQDEGFIGRDFFSDSEEWVASSIGESPAGATLAIIKRRDGQGYSLQWRDGGQVANEYRGWYTTYEKAESAARVYLAIMWEEARKKAS